MAKAQAALMYDTVTHLSDTLNRMLRKKSDTFRVINSRGGSGSSGGGNVYRGLECNNSREWVNAWEHGERIVKFVRKVKSLLGPLNNHNLIQCKLYVERGAGDACKQLPVDWNWIKWIILGRNGGSDGSFEIRRSRTEGEFHTQRRRDDRQQRHRQGMSVNSINQYPEYYNQSLTSAILHSSVKIV